MTKATTDSDWMTSREVARALGVSDDTVRRWAESGHLPKPHRFSLRVWRWRKADIERAIAAAKSK
jgi:excisionase family DNA binding protein